MATPVKKTGSVTFDTEVWSKVAVKTKLDDSSKDALSTETESVWALLKDTAPKSTVKSTALEIRNLVNENDIILDFDLQY